MFPCKCVLFATTSEGFKLFVTSKGRPVPTDPKILYMYKTLWWKLSYEEQKNYHVKALKEALEKNSICEKCYERYYFFYIDMV